MKKLIITFILVLICGILFGQNSIDLRNELVSRLVGEWTNINPKTPNLTKLIISYESNEFSIEAFGNCTPTDCEWGNVKAHEIAASIDIDFNILPFDYLLAIWEFDGQIKNAMTKIMKIEIETGPKPKLHIETISLFNDNRESSEYHLFETMVKKSQTEI